MHPGDELEMHMADMPYDAEGLLEGIKIARSYAYLVCADSWHYGKNVGNEELYALEPLAYALADNPGRGDIVQIRYELESTYKRLLHVGAPYEGVRNVRLVNIILASLVVSGPVIMVLLALLFG